MKTLVITILLLFISCSSGTKIQKTNNDPIESERKDKKSVKDNENEFSVLPYDKDDLKFPKEVQLDSDSGEKEKEKKTKSGYRIQVESFKDFQMFRNFIKKLKTEISHTDYVIYDNIFHSPYFKVRVGDFEDRDEAKQALPIFIDLGYKGAYPVKDNIIVYE
jgi:hypothetical protein